MKKTLLIFILTPLLYFSQDNGNKLVLGVNIGGYAANKNTAGLYNGNVTPINILSIFDNPHYQPNFINYFQYPSYIYDIPRNPQYRIGLDVGVHIGKRFQNGELFAEINFANISVQDFFIVAIEDPNNLSPDPTYEPIPIFGEERRSNINFGYSFDLYNKDGIIIGFPIFSQINNVRLQRNYFVINNQQYNIYHGVAGQTNTNPGGTAIGGGAGLTGSIKFNDQFSFLAGYYAQYSKINLIENNELTAYDENSQQIPGNTVTIKPWGLHHSIFARIIWSW